MALTLCEFQHKAQLPSKENQIGERPINTLNLKHTVAFKKQLEMSNILTRNKKVYHSSLVETGRQ